MKKLTALLALLTVLFTHAAMAEDNAKLQELQHALAANPNDETLLKTTALILYQAGKYDEAAPLYQRRLKIIEQKQGKNHVDVALALNDLATVYKEQGKYDLAQPLFERSLGIREKAFGADDEKVARSLNNLAELYYVQGKYSQAENLYQRGLIILEKQLGKEHTDVATVLNNIAVLYRDQGKYDQAEPLYQRSLEITEKALGKEHSDVATTLDNFAALYRLQGSFNKAEDLYQRSLAIKEKALGKEHIEVARNLNNLAVLYKDQSKYAEAEALLQRSLAINEKTLGKDHPEVANTLNNLAAVYDAQQKYQLAEPLYLRSLAITEQALGKDHPDVSFSLNNLALLDEALGKYSEAEALYQRSLKILQNAFGKQHPLIAETLSNFAGLYLTQGKYDAAKPLLEQSFQLSNQLLEHWLWGAGEKTRQSYLQQQQGKRNIYLSFYSLANMPEQALYYSLSRKNLLLRIASEASILAKQSTDPVIQKQIQALNALRTQLANLTFSDKSNKADVQVLEEKANQLDMQLSQRVAALKHSKSEVTVKDLLKKLSPNQVLVDFLLYRDVNFKEKRYQKTQIIALIADTKGVRLIKLGELEPVAKAIKTYQAAIVPNEKNLKSREQMLKQSAQALYIQLWQPLTPYLKNKTTVYLVPDGELHLLPFKALQDKNGKYLGEKQQLTILSSARDIVLPPLTAKAQSAAIFAGPDYGLKTESNVTNTRVTDIYFSPLTGALSEGEQLKKLFNQKLPKVLTKLFAKTDATEQTIKQLGTPKILHLATHGFFFADTSVTSNALDSPTQSNKQNALTRSGLAFANANLGEQADQSDGILTALEVLNLKLQGTNLVVLSACDTAKGDVNIGEGVYSLNRAFQEAGAKSVLSTLWAINDEATIEFMQKFYRRFLNGKSAQQAIQETQTEFMHHKTYSDPFYWAGFVMMSKE